MSEESQSRVVERREGKEGGTVCSCMTDCWWWGLGSRGHGGGDD